MELIFATHNKNKVAEIRALPGIAFSIISLEEAGMMEEIPEPWETLEENAREKSQTIYRATGKDCFSEDTGLEVEALNGAPGVYSARYAGQQKSAADNICKLLKELEGVSNRSARFRTVISLILNGTEHRFEGVCPGQIRATYHGTHGFGYDPIFQPDAAEKTFAEMELTEKNQYSHRAKAFAQLLDFLNSHTIQGHGKH